MNFKIISTYFEKLSNTSSRLEMTSILHELFSLCPKEELQNLIYFCQGNLDAKYKSVEMNIGQSTILSIIAEYVSKPIEDIKKDFLELGDLGLVVEKNYSSVKQQTLFSKELSFEEIYSTFKKIAGISGKGAIDKKLKLFKFVLFNSDSISAKYLVRFPISFRLGFSDATIIDALSTIDKHLPQNEAKKLITSKYLIISDLGLIAKLIVTKGLVTLNELHITPFIPIKSQLCERAKDINEIVDRLSGDDKKLFAVDSKIDGFRQQIHKKGDEVKIYTRQEIDVTSMFPDIVIELKKINHDFIIDSEAIGFDIENNKYHTFQITMQRKRKYDLTEKSKELPLHLKVFDLLYFDGEEVYNLDFRSRRKILEENFNIKPIIETTDIIYTNDSKVVTDFFNNRLSLNFEGIICKDLDSSYKAGSRGFSWIKFKKSYKSVHDTIDAVVVGAFYGQGKRSDLGVGALLMALYDPDTNKYYTLAKLGSGLSDDIMRDLTNSFEKTKLTKKPENLVSNIIPDFYVTPEIVIEINFDEITSSNVHTCCYDNVKKQGLALRFPRLTKIRFDKKSETDTPALLHKLYSFQ